MENPYNTAALLSLGKSLEIPGLKEERRDLVSLVFLHCDSVILQIHWEKAMDLFKEVLEMKA